MEAAQPLTHPRKWGPWGSDLVIGQPEPRGGVPAHVGVRGTGAVEPLCELGGLAQASDRTTGGTISLESPRRSLPPEGHTANDTAVTVSLKSRLTPAEAWEVKTRPENGSRPPRV